MNYISSSKLEKINDLIKDGSWWFIHLRNKDINRFWEAWGYGAHVDAWMRTGVFNTRGTTLKKKKEGILQEAVSKSNSGYIFIGEAKVPIKTEVMGSGFARTTIDEKGSYGVDFYSINEDDVQDKQWMITRLTKNKRPKKDSHAIKFMKEMKSCTVSDDNLFLDRKLQKKILEQEYVDSIEAYEASKLECYETSKLIDEKRREYERRKKEVFIKKQEKFSIKDLMNKRKRESEW